MYIKLILVRLRLDCRHETEMVLADFDGNDVRSGSFTQYDHLHNSVNLVYRLSESSRSSARYCRPMCLSVSYDCNLTYSLLTCGMRHLCLDDAEAAPSHRMLTKQHLLPVHIPLWTNFIADCFMSGSTQARAAYHSIKYRTSNRLSQVLPLSERKPHAYTAHAGFCTKHTAFRTMCFVTDVSVVKGCTPPVCLERFRVSSFQFAWWGYILHAYL